MSNTFGGDSNFYGQDIEIIERKLLELCELDDEQLKDKNEDIISMIKYTIDLTNAIEERRNKMYTDSLTFVGLVVGISTILFTVAEWSNLFLIPIIFFGIQLISHLIIIWKYYSQNESKYVFKEGALRRHANQWKWFYYGNKHILDINVNSTDEASVSSYINGFCYFADNYISENIRSQISSNIRQLYLLQVHNYYKNRFCLQLAEIQHKGFLCSICGAIITIFIILIPVLRRALAVWP